MVDGVAIGTRWGGAKERTKSVTKIEEGNAMEV